MRYQSRPVIPRPSRAVPEPPGEFAQRSVTSHRLASTERSGAERRVIVDRMRRAGKSVTVASGFRHTSVAFARHAAVLKKECGAGDTAQEEEIEIQGDHVGRVAAELERLGDRVKK